MESVCKIGFWSHTNGNYKCFSNFYPCTFTYKDHQFNCSEQAFMWMKAITFNDTVIANKILLESDPKKIKALGREVHNYDDNIWNDKRYEIMLEVNIAKYMCNEKLKNILLNTREAYLYEDSPFDYIWGIGKNGTGKNLLGRVLMEIRDKYIM